jgi:hypothetical protein
MKAWPNFRRKVSKPSFLSKKIFGLWRKKKDFKREEIFSSLLFLGDQIRSSKIEFNDGIFPIQDG